MPNRAVSLRLVCSLFTLPAAVALILTSAFDAPAQPVITNAPGYVITWDGNNGDNPTSPTVPTNIALASQGAVAYASGQLGPEIGAAFHYVTNLNDGFYGNTKSWIGGTNDPAPWFAGVQLPAAVPLTGIAWGRDNTGVSQDRCLGTYTVQIATNASFTTNASAWTTLGTITYTNSAAGFAPWLRHRYKLARATGGQILATGVRLLVPDSGLVATGTDIDELELFGSAAVNLAYWRMGENDSGAANGVTNTATTNLLGGVLTLQSNAVYSSSVASTAASQVASSLALQFTTGRYATNALITTLTDNFGLELWVQPDATNGVQCLAHNGTTGGGGAGGWGIYLIEGQYTGLFGGLTTVGGAPATPGVWTHLALVRNNGTSTLYVNGNPAGTSPATPDLPQGRFALAAQPQSLNTEFFAGALDEVRVFAFAPGSFSTSELLLAVLPPTVATAAATDIGGTSATLNGIVNPQNLTTATWFEWGPTTNYGNYTATNTLAATNVALAVSNTLAGLTAATTYHYRVVASNALGTNYGLDQLFIPATFTLVPIAGLPGVSSSSVAWGDYDNDGLLDFFLTGNGAGYFSQLWRNTGSGFVLVPVSGLPGVRDSSVAWGDYDNDGRLDFLVTGTTNGSLPGAITKLFRNTGGGFVSVSVPGLAQVAFGSVTWVDYDNDGRLDFLITGQNASSTRVIQLWRNTGSGFTSVSTPGLLAVNECSVAWGDYDNDGRPDLLLAGNTESDVAALYRNTDSGFTDVTASVVPGLPGARDCRVAWGDYDNDGRLDFLITGLSGASRITQLWRNTGSGFTNVFIPDLPGVERSSVAWGDYDNDGRLDFLLTGYLGGISSVAQLWRNTGSGFTNVPVAGLQGVDSGSLAWADYDNDGRLDFLLTGYYNGNFYSQLWRNNAPVTNAPPTAPTGLAMTTTTNAVMLSWNSATDGQTPASGLTYNVRAGSTPGGIDLFAGHVNATNGFRRVPALGNAYLRHSLPLTGLTNGQTVYWSVQAVDTAFAGGPFATETSVVSIPQLAIAAGSATNALVSWTPPTFGWVLQESPSLVPAAWSNSPSGELNPATVSATNAAQFYRLINP